MMLEEVYILWFNDYGIDKKTAREDERKWAVYIRPTFGRLEIDSLDYTSVRQWHRQITTQRGPVMANRALTLLTTVCRYAVSALRITTVDPTAAVRANTERSRTRYLTPVEVSGIFRALDTFRAKDPKGCAFIELAALTGARKGELESVSWGDIHENVIVLKNHKTDELTGRPRVIHLPQAARDVLARLKTGAPASLVLGHSPRGLWDRVREAAGLWDVHLHDLRHTLASILISHHGASLKDVADLLGHTNTGTANRYAHLMQEAASNLSEAASKTLMGC